MVLVDTSVWIEAFAARPRVDLAALVDIEEIVPCLPVLHVDRDFDLLASIAPLRVRAAR